MTPPIGALKAAALLGSSAAVVFLRRTASRCVAIEEFVDAIHELVFYHDIRELRVAYGGGRAADSGNARP